MRFRYRAWAFKPGPTHSLIAHNVHYVKLREPSHSRYATDETELPPFFGINRRVFGKALAVDGSLATG